MTMFRLKQRPYCPDPAWRPLMWTCSRRCLLTQVGIVALAGCTDGGFNDPYWQSPFYENDWIYYYEEDDEYFVDGLTDAQEDALRQKWASLAPEEKQEILDRWGALREDQRASVREAWGDLDAGQREAVLSSMQARARTGTLRTVMPPAALPSPRQASPGTGFDGSRAGSYDRGSLGRSGAGSLGGRGGGALGGSSRGGRGGGGGVGGGGRR